MQSIQPQGKKEFTKLFVAGVPSGIDPRYVLDYFSRYGKFELCEDSYNDSENGKFCKGYCNLLSYNKLETELLVGQKFFAFLGRTLTVTKHKTGVKLIIHNKMINQCRVIIKRVPGYFSEADLREELSAICGQIQSLFQFKARIPNNLGTVDSCSQFKVYSVVFLRKDVAQKLIFESKLILSNGAVVIAEPYLKGQKNYHRNNYKQEKVVKEPFMAFFDKQPQLINSDDTSKTHVFLQFGEKRMIWSKDYDHAIRPTSSQYQARFEAQVNSTWLFSNLYRFNRSTKRGVPRTQPGIEI